MPAWAALKAGWKIAAWTATAIMKSPGNYVDLYYRDRYVVISKRALVVGVVAVMLVPLAFAISHLVRVFSR